MPEFPACRTASRAEVENLQHLLELTYQCSDRFMRFEFSQKDLETYTEELSGFTERPIAEVAREKQKHVYFAAALRQYIANVEREEPPDEEKTKKQEQAAKLQRNLNKVQETCPKRS